MSRRDSDRRGSGAQGARQRGSGTGATTEPLSPVPRSELVRPLILVAAIVILDQITKFIIVQNVPLIYETGFMIEVIGDFLRIIHARNLGIAFSIGDSLPFWLRKTLFVAMPIGVLIVLYVSFYRSPELTRMQRWAVASILGGGIGNIIDRIFRPLGVVDFIDVRFYGLFGLERWPTFNVADSSVVVGGVLLIVSMLFAGRAEQ
jgi:signal peptidase II